MSTDWLSHRSEIRVLDCTIRDGGLMNNHHFEDRIVKAVYDACVAGGIDYMEIGYRASRKNIKLGEHGCWKYCQEEDIRRIVGENATALKLSIMADAGKCDYREDIPAKQESVIDLVRVACYVHGDCELEAALELLAPSEAQAIYVVDSFGALYPLQTRRLVQKYLQHAKACGKEVGIHAHNNLQLAYANTIEAIVLGANYLDATMAGLGRGAGNCHMELLLGLLRDPQYQLRPVLQCVAETIEPLRHELGWGFDLPYLLTGLFNQHPRAAIDYNAQPETGDIGAFFDSF
ncbi:aldolase catalytic domain-containing protein [Prosthecobacter sp.]|uniref:aldolase catalytic domain-containing protein n=1 Tax=Prosthecobacter sp. TaxID=1965333 RepID=UPI0037844F1B